VKHSSSIKCHENTFRDFRVVPCMKMDWRTESEHTMCSAGSRTTLKLLMTVPKSRCFEHRLYTAVHLAVWRQKRELKLSIAAGMSQYQIPRYVPRWKRTPSLSTDWQLPWQGHSVFNVFQELMGSVTRLTRAAANLHNGAWTWTKFSHFFLVYLCIPCIHLFFRWALFCLSIYLSIYLSIDTSTFLFLSFFLSLFFFSVLYALLLYFTLFLSLLCFLASFLFLSSLIPVGCLPLSLYLFIYLFIMYRSMGDICRTHKKRGKYQWTFETYERTGKFMQNFSQETWK
jgi:hypothetical protein